MPGKWAVKVETPMNPTARQVTARFSRRRGVARRQRNRDRYETKARDCGGERRHIFDVGSRYALGPRRITLVKGHFCEDFRDTVDIVNPRHCWNTNGTEK